MKKTQILLMLGLLFALSVGAHLSVNFCKAEQYTGLITIQSDGSIVPQTDSIQRQGYIYYLTRNLSSARIDINCSNLVFDGQGYAINGSGHFVLGGKGITLENINNVTIRNVVVVGYFEPSISLSNCSNVTISQVQTGEKPDLITDVSDSIYLDNNSDGNTICYCVGGVRVQSGSLNTIYGSNVTLLINSPNNLIYNNNIKVNYYLSSGVNATPYPIIGTGATFNRWDNGSVGNYWSDYSGQGVYELDKNNIDHHPLSQPVAVSPVPYTPLSSPYVPELPPWRILALLMATILFTAAIIAAKKSLRKTLQPPIT